MARDASEAGRDVLLGSFRRVKDGKLAKTDTVKASNLVRSGAKRPKFAGQVDSLARSLLIGLVFGQDKQPEFLQVRDGLNKDSKRLRDELAGSSPSALERLLAERIATCYSVASMADYQLAGTIERNSFSF